MKFVRAGLALVLAVLGCWCLLWVPLFGVLASYAEDGWADFFRLLATAVVLFGAALVVQPWWRLPWRRGHEQAPPSI